MITRFPVSLSGLILALLHASASAGTIGNLVFVDGNGDGVQAAGEQGLGGVVVTLISAGANNAIGGGDDTTVATTSTNAAGNYSFNSVPAGTYYLVFATPNGRAFTTRDAGGDDSLDSDGNLVGQTATFSLTDAQIDNTRDAGVVRSATLSGMVFEDDDRDGIRDSGELGLAGVRVRVLSVGADATIATADDLEIGAPASDADGEYAVSTGLAPGNYFAQFELPNGRLFTLANQGADDSVDSDADSATGLSGVVALALAQEVGGVDAGVFETAAVGDLVFEDLDGDGVQDSGEPGYPGVVVELFNAGADGASGGGDDVSQGSRTSNASGAYVYDDLQPGIYYLTLTTPTGAGLAPLDQGGSDASDSDFDPATGQSALFAITPGQTDLSRDGGLFDLVSVTGRVFGDSDGDGVRETGEGALAANATVALFSAGANGVIGGGDDVVVAQLATLSTFSFSTVAPGTYFLAFTGPAGLGVTRQDQGADDALDSDANANGVTAPFTITSGQTEITRDAGYVAYATVGSLVFLDASRDGVQQTGEAGIDGVLVSLYRPGANALAGDDDDEFVVSAVTAGGGFYTLSAAPGAYYASVALPARRVFTRVNQGADDALDSDINPINGRSDSFVLAASEINNNIDAGLLIDSDGDGVDDESDGCPEDTGKTAPGDCGCGAVDVDTDADGVAACVDNCPNDFNGDQTDSDGDGIGNGCDNCVALANPSQSDRDGDGIGDACDAAPEEATEEDAEDAAAAADEQGEAGPDDGGEGDDGDDGGDSGGDDDGAPFDPDLVNCGACAPVSSLAYLLSVAAYGGLILARRHGRDRS